MKCIENTFYLLFYTVSDQNKTCAFFRASVPFNISVVFSKFHFKNMLSVRHQTSALRENGEGKLKHKKAHE